MADMLTPQDLWEQFDDTLPLNAASELQREDSKVRIEKVTFDGRDTGQGRVRVYAKFATDPVKGIQPYTVIILPDACRGVEDDLFEDYVSKGYNVLMLDYRGYYDGLEPAWRKPQPTIIRRLKVRPAPEPAPLEEQETPAASEEQEAAAQAEPPAAEAPAAEPTAEENPVTEDTAETPVETSAEDTKEAEAVAEDTADTPAEEAASDTPEAPADESAEVETAAAETEETAETDTTSETSEDAEPAVAETPSENTESAEDTAATEDTPVEESNETADAGETAATDTAEAETESTAVAEATEESIEEDSEDARALEAAQKPTPVEAEHADESLDADSSVAEADTAAEDAVAPANETPAEDPVQEPTADETEVTDVTEDPVPAEELEKLEEEDLVKLEAEVLEPATAETEDTDTSDTPVEEPAEQADADKSTSVAEDAAEAPAQTSEKLEDITADADESAETEDICAVKDTADPVESPAEDTAEPAQEAENAPAEDTPAQDREKPAQEAESSAELPAKDTEEPAQDDSESVVVETAEDTAVQEGTDTVPDVSAKTDIPVEYTDAEDSQQESTAEAEEVIAEADSDGLDDPAEGTDAVPAEGEQEAIELDDSLKGEDDQTPELERQEEIGTEQPPEDKEPEEDVQLQIDLDKALAEAARNKEGEEQEEQAVPEEKEEPKPAELEKPEEPEYEEIIIEPEPSEPHLGEYYTVYPDNVKYANYEECKDNLCFADNGADKTCWYEWTAVGLYARQYIKERTGSDKIAVIGIREGGEVMWKMAAARKFCCAIPVCAAGWKTSAGKMKFEKPVKETANFSVSLSGEISEEKKKVKKAGKGKKGQAEKKPDYTNTKFNFMAGLDSQSYAPYVQCPVLVVCSVNDPRFDYDRAYDTYLRINQAYTAESSIVYAMNYNSFIDRFCTDDMDLFLKKHLKGNHVFLPKPVVVDIYVDRMQNLTARVLTDQEGVSSELSVYFAEDTINPVLRTWTQAERVKGTRNEFMLNIYEGTKSLFVLASAKYTNGFKSWSKVIVKSISGRFRNMLHHSPVLYSSLIQNDGFTPVGLGKHAKGGVFLKQSDADREAVQVSEVLGVKALSAPDGVQTYRISKPRYAPNPKSIMFLDIYVKEDTNIYLIITDLKTGEDYVFTDYIVGDIWQSLELSANAFKCGHKSLPSFVCEGMLTIRADGYFAVNNIMWL